MSGVVLGVSCFYHDAAACLVKGGEIVAAAQEERFTRVKHDPRFPRAAINYVLERGARDVTAVCLLAAPEGIEVLKEAVGGRADVSVVVAAVDSHLTDKAYIYPGLGDAGDRLYGIVD